VVVGAVVAVVVRAGVVVAAFVVVAARVVVARVVVATGLEVAGGGFTATVVVGGTALGPVAIGSVEGSATSFAEAIPPNPSSASEVSSRARRSTDPR
jgi:hypothetical protein